MRMLWRTLAFGLVGATLSLGIAACGDDTSTTPDMAMGGGADMSASVDMASQTPGNGQITLADLVGTAWNGATPLPRVHTLTTVASFAKFAGTPDPSSNLTLGPPPTGCTINRYDFTATPPKVPGADADAGNIVMAGYSTMVIGTDTKTGINSPPQAQITCGRGGMLNTYNCFYGTMPSTDGGSAGMGALTGDVVYAPLPLAALGLAACPGSTLITPGPPPTTYCEQYPIPPGGFAVISETVTGGADYNVGMTPLTKMLGSGKGEDAGAGGLPDNITIVSVKSGTTEISGIDPVDGSIPPGSCPAGSALGCQRNLDLTDAMVDQTKDLTIQWSCDGSQTAASGCTGGDFLGVLLTTSQNAKGTFSKPQSAKFGVGQCVEAVAKPMATATVKSNQLTALFGGQTGGSMQIAVVRLGVSIAPVTPHLIIFTAGHGRFGFTNLP